MFQAEVHRPHRALEGKFTQEGAIRRIGRHRRRGRNLLARQERARHADLDRALARVDLADLDGGRANDSDIRIVDEGIQRLRFAVEGRQVDRVRLRLGIGIHGRDGTRFPVREDVVHRARELLPEFLAFRRAVAELARTAREPLQHALARRVGLPVDGDERKFLAALGERLAGLHVGRGGPIAEDHHELPRRHPVRELGLLAGGLQLLALRAARTRPEDDHRNVVFVRIGLGGREVAAPGSQFHRTGDRQRTAGRKTGKPGHHGRARHECLQFHVCSPFWLLFLGVEKASSRARSSQPGI